MLQFLFWITGLKLQNRWKLWQEISFWKAICTHPQNNFHLFAPNLDIGWCCSTCKGQKLQKYVKMIWRMLSLLIWSKSSLKNILTQLISENFKWIWVHSDNSSEWLEKVQEQYLHSYKLKALPQTRVRICVPFYFHV